MKKEELENLKICDVVTISARASRNYGKRGTVAYIGVIWEGRGTTGIYVKPLDCEFEFGKSTTLNQREIRTHTYMYRHTALKLENKEPEKRDKSLEIKFVGSEEDIKKMTEEIKEIVKTIAPEAKLVISRGEK